jgi:carboxylesterase
MNKELVVIINGAGTNGMELKALYKKLAENEKYFVYFPGFLPGVFTGDYFPKSTTKDFKRFIDETIEMMKQFETVYLIGYSLGASTAAVISAKFNGIKKLVLISPIVKNPNYSKFLRWLSYSVAYDKNLTRVQKIFFSEFVKRFIKVPKIHVFHLQMYLLYIRKYLKQITVPTLIIETINDELVKKKSIDMIVRNIKNDHIDRYPVDSSHFLFFDKAVRSEVIEKIESFLEEE